MTTTTTDTRLSVVVSDPWGAGAAAALALDGEAAVAVDGAGAAIRDSAECVLCAPGHVAALAAARPRPAIVALIPGDARGASIAALERGADECVGCDADGPALRRAAALAVARRALAERARRDSLTGTADRALLDECLTAALGAIPAGPGVLAVLFVDLDGFKAVNDRHGHAVGDRVLVDVAGRLQIGVRPNDLVARYGGDEFVVVCEHVHPGEARSIATRLEQRLAQPIGLDGWTLKLAASIGVSTTRDPHTPPALLVARADADMYRVKQAQRALRRVATR
jgi:diguanylate cyclase (GGDEF)-like protein